jgi:hypothetical protein
MAIAQAINLCGNSKAHTFDPSAVGRRQQAFGSRQQTLGRELG